MDDEHNYHSSDVLNPGSSQTQVSLKSQNPCPIMTGHSCIAQCVNWLSYAEVGKKGSHLAGFEPAIFPLGGGRLATRPQELCLGGVRKDIYRRKFPSSHDSCKLAILSNPFYSCYHISCKMEKKYSQSRTPSSGKSVTCTAFFTVSVPYTALSDLGRT